MTKQLSLFKLFGGILTIIGLIFTAPLAHAENGVTDQEVTIGMANALTGPASGLGNGVKIGASAYFNAANSAGGIKGHKIKLISVDDGYEPSQTATATKNLIDEQKVFALFGYVGTPTSNAAIPLAVASGVPYVAPFTGAESLRNPVNKFVFNVRPSYFNETEELVNYFTTKLGAKKVAVFIQDDAFGEAGKGGVAKALAKRSMQIAAEGRYKRNTTDVTAALDTIKAAAPDTVIMVGTYAATAEFVKKARAAHFFPNFANISFVGTENFIKAAGVDAEGVYISEVMPSPEDTSVPIVAQFQKDMKAAGNTAFEYTNLEGYVDAVVFGEALSNASPSITRDSFMKAFDGLNKDIGGMQVAYSSTNHQGLSKVYLIQVKNGKPTNVAQ